MICSLGGTKFSRSSCCKVIVFSGILTLIASASGVYRGHVGDKYLVRMDELVTPLDRHILHIEKPSLLTRALVRRKIMKKSQSLRSRRSPDGGRITYDNNHNCGQQKIPFDPPLYNIATTYIQNGTCTPYGAFPWTVQIQVNFQTWALIASTRSKIPTLGSYNNLAL